LEKIKRENKITTERTIDAEEVKVVRERFNRTHQVQVVGYFDGI
jgi:hypothetical protein